MKLNKPEMIQYLHLLGTVAKNALGDLQSECQSSALLTFPDLIFEFQRVPLGTPFKRMSYVDPQLFETVGLGASVHELHTQRIKSKTDLSEKEIDSIVNKSRTESVRNLLDDILDSFSGLQKRFNK
jgi:hypothetical protein